MIDTKVIAGGTATVAVASFAAMEAHAPDGFWPVTVTGWLTMASSVCALIVSGYLLYKKSLSPVVGSIGMVDKKISDVEKHFDKELIEIEKRVSAKVDGSFKHMEERMNAFTQTTERTLNGFGNRQDEFHERLEQSDTDYAVINRQMGQSQEDRRHLNEAVERIEASQGRIIELLLTRGGK